MVILLFCVSRNTRRVDFPRVDGLSTDTPGLGCHKNSQRDENQGQRRSYILAFSFRDKGNKARQIMRRGDPVERKGLKTSSKSLMYE